MQVWVSRTNIFKFHHNNFFIVNLHSQCWVILTLINIYIVDISIKSKPHLLNNHRSFSTGYTCLGTS